MIDKQRMRSGSSAISLITGVLILAAMTAHPATAHASDHTRSFVLKAGKIHPVSRILPVEIEDGIIVVRDGRIVTVGKAIDLPPDLPVFEFPDAVVMPGLISAAGQITPQHNGEETISGLYMAADAFLAYRDYDTELASGVTTVHLTPGEHRLISGHGAVVSLGGPVDQRILATRSDISVNVGEGAYQPPNIVRYQTPASSDVALPEPIRQRPFSRLGAFLALEDWINTNTKQALGENADLHTKLLAASWHRKTPLRIHADRKADLENTLNFLSRHNHEAYVVGAAELNGLQQRILDTGLPVVYRVRQTLGGIGSDMGFDPDQIRQDMDALGRMSTRIQLALAVPQGRPVSHLRLSAALALRHGMPRKRVLEAITHVPAKILGVDDEVGSLHPGKRADFVIFTGDPLATTSHVKRVYVGGELSFEAPEVDAMVVRAGTVWVDEDTRLHDAEVLIEEGRIAAVGQRVPRPPFSSYYDAGDDAFVSPGLIDARGHLGLEGDGGAPAPNIALSKLIGAADVTDHRVAAAGVTTVMLTPYACNPMGSQVSAVKTYGNDRNNRVVKDATGVAFNFRRNDPMEITSKLKARMKAVQGYREKWQKYQKELAEWEEKKAKGELEEQKAESEKSKSKEDSEPDPITGTWNCTISGGPIPEPATGKIRLRLTGTDIEGRILVAGAPEDLKIVATLDGKIISGEIQADTGGMGYPQITAEIVEEDRISGTISFQNLEVSLEANRVDKKDVAFKVVKRRTRGKDGKPLPPKVDEGLEPLRAALDEKIPVVISVDSPAQINAVLAVLEKYKFPLVLESAQDASAVQDVIKEKEVGVIVPNDIVRWRNQEMYNQADDLSRHGLHVAFQSNAEDAARNLPLLGLFAVERGMSPDAALAALTTAPAKMYKLHEEIGSLNVGCHGDLVVFSGHPFETGSRVKRVIVGGEIVR
ncbi:MAG: amidohydrolase family protein [Phycisphaerae bacterium]